MPNAKYGHVVSHRLTDEEYKMLQRRAKDLGVPQSRVMGSLLMGTAATVEEQLKSLGERITKLEAR